MIGGLVGLEIATAYARLGAAVMLVGRNEERVQAAADQLNREGGKAAATRCDVRNYDEVKSAVEATVERFGSLDILVNNAAGNFVCPSSELSPNGFRTVIDIDLNGTFYGCHAAYPHLKASRHGTPAPGAIRCGFPEGAMRRWLTRPFVWAWRAVGLTWLQLRWRRLAQVAVVYVGAALVLGHVLPYQCRALVPRRYPKRPVT